MIIGSKHTVEPLNKGHFGDTASVLSRRLSFSEVKNINALKGPGGVSFVRYRLSLSWRVLYWWRSAWRIMMTMSLGWWWQTRSTWPCCYAAGGREGGREGGGGESDLWIVVPPLLPPSWVGGPRGYPFSHHQSFMSLVHAATPHCLVCVCVFLFFFAPAGHSFLKLSTLWVRCGVNSLPNKTVRNCEIDIKQWEM